MRYGVIMAVSCEYFCLMENGDGYAPTNQMTDVASERSSTYEIMDLKKCSLSCTVGDV